MNTTPAAAESSQPTIDWSVFTPALLLVVLIGGGLIFYPEQGATLTAAAMNFVTSKLGWLYLALGGGALCFAGWLAFGPYGGVLLGTPGEPPEYSELHWIAMMFTAGIGGSMIAWGVAEPISYLEQTPFGIEPFSSEAVEWAHVYPIFHWGFVPWAFYAIPTVPVAYMLYVHKTPMLKVSGACESALPLAQHPWAARTIDTVIALGIVGGTATSLGLGVPLVSALMAELFGVADNMITKLVVLVLWTALFGASAYRGLKKGIKILADINMVVAVLALALIALAGPTLFILSISVNSIGLLTSNFLHMIFWTDPVEQSGFPEAWTVFYWAWWIAFAPFVGLFCGRISRGRTIKHVVLGVIGWGTLGTSVFMAIMGGYSLYLESSGELAVSAIQAEFGMATVTAKVIASLPMGQVTVLIFLVLSIIFYATTLDSAAYTIASVCSNNLQNHQEPPRSSRVTWACALALLSMSLIATENVQIVQASTVISSLPLLPVLILMCMSLVKWLHKDYGSVAPKHDP